MSEPLGLTYNGLITQVALLAPYQVQTVSGVVQGPPEFNALIPQMMQYAEQRIQRDIELLATQVFRHGFTRDPPPTNCWCRTISGDPGRAGVQQRRRRRRRSPRSARPTS